MREILKIQPVDNPHFAALCHAYVQLVSQWNTIINLVSSGDVDNLLKELIAQSVKPLETIRPAAGSRLLDVGSGGGIPALPLKFARPDLQVTMIEPRRKKWLFLQRAIGDLKLTGVEALRARLEEASAREDWQRRFDLITTRGTGAAGDLYPWMAPLLKPGGMIWFYKGLAASREAHELNEQVPGAVRVVPLDRRMSLLVVQPEAAP